MNPYIYSDQPHDRKHQPLGYSSNRGVKPWLWDEFSFRCGYCLHRERWGYDGAASFSIDHVHPKSSHRQLKNDNNNLVYAGCCCHSCKGAQDFGVDSTAVAFGELLQVDLEGRVQAQDSKDGCHLRFG